jgi:hypothetical protein
VRDRTAAVRPDKEAFVNAFIRLVRRSSGWALGAWFLLAAAGGGLFLGRFEIDNSVGVWFPEGDPALAGYERFLDTFGPWEWDLLLVAPRRPPDGVLLVELKGLENRLRAHPGIRQVLDPAALAALDPGGGASVPPSGSLPFLLETANEIHRGDDFRAELLEAIDREVEACPGIASHTLVGTSVINVGLNRSARRDMLLFFNLVFLLLAGVSWLLLRAWRDVAVLLAVSVSAVAMTLGLVAVTGTAFNILTIMMPTVLIALSVANLVHLVHAFHEHRRHGAASDEAAVRAAREVRLPALGTTLTTVIGFLSLAVSDMPPVRQLALFSAAGILTAWLGTLAVAPVLLGRVWRGRSAGRRGGARTAVLDAWARRVPGLGPVLLVLVLGAVPVLAGLGRLEADTNYVEFFRPGSRVRSAYETAKRAGMAQSVLDVVVRTPGASDPGDLAPFLEAVGEQPEVRGVLAPGAGPDLRGFVDDGGTAFRAALFVDFMGNDDVGALSRRVRSLGNRLLPEGWAVEVTGSPVLWERMDASIVRTQQGSILLVALGAFVLLALFFRDLRAAAIGWFCSALPVGIILGIMGWLGVPVTLATVLIAGIALGLAVDDTVHFVFAVRRRLAAGRGRREAVRDALVTVGERMVVTSLILSGSFSVMAFSDFVPTAGFGIFTALTILLALAADMALLPWLLTLGTRGWRPSTRAHTAVHERVRTRPDGPGPASVSAAPTGSGEGV